jgi:F-type H+-transporting ATPase subunit delta
MIELTLAKRYAAGLLEVAREQGAVQQVRLDLRALSELSRSSRDFADVLRHPRIPRPRRMEIITAALKDRVSAATLGLIKVLIDKNRTKYIPDIEVTFIQLADAAEGVVRARVKSFLPVTDAELAVLKIRLAARTGKTVVIDAEIDKSLMGGMLVRIGDTVIDGSVAGKLKALRELLEKRPGS